MAVLAIMFSILAPMRADAVDGIVVQPGKTVVIPETSATGLEGTIRTEVRLDSLPSAGSLYVTLETRSSEKGLYQTQVRVYPSGNAYLTVKRGNTTDAGTNYITLGQPVRLSDAATAGSQVELTTTLEEGVSASILKTSARIGASGVPKTLRVTDESSSRLSTTGTSRGTLYAASAGDPYTVTVLSSSAVFDSSPEPSVPVEEPSEPTEPSAPVEEPSAPVEEPSAPVEEPSAPVEEPSAPVEEPSAPAKPSTPVEEPSAPVEEPSAPVEEPSAPVEEPSAPAKPSTPTTPDATTTGVPAGTTLTVHDGDLIVTEPNTVISGLEVRGAIVIEAPGVVIRNSKIVGGTQARSTGLVSNVVSGQPFTIMDSEIYAAHRDSLWVGIFGSNFTAERVNVHGVVDPIHVIGDNVVVRNSWLHDNDHWEQDPLRGGTPSHDDSIQIVAGSSILIEGNRLEDAHNAAIQISQASSRSQLGSITIRNNFLQGGACTVNIAPTPWPINAKIVSNEFGPDRLYATCAITATKANAPKLSGNVWAETGAALTDYVVVK